MIADMRVLDLGDAILLDLPGGVTSAVHDRLSQFVITEDVEVADVTPALAHFGVYGPAAAGTISAALDRAGVASDTSSAGGQLAGLEPFASLARHAAGAPVTVAGSDEFGVRGFDLFVPVEHAASLAASLRGAGAVDVDPDAAEVHRVEAGRPAFGADMDEDTIPLEAGIEQRAISFTKGCYVGQEIIIRVLHRGHGRVARRLMGLILRGADGAARGDRVRAADRDVGVVTSAVWSPALERPIALAYVHRDFAEPGTAVSVLHDGRTLDAAVAPLPFIQPAAR
jgi:folate-binding protein YgfZ